MISKVNNFILDYLTINNYTLSIDYGLVIRKICPTEQIDVAKIIWYAPDKSCYIETISDNLQNYVVTYADYQDFIRLVDEAYYKITLANLPELEGQI